MANHGIFVPRQIGAMNVDIWNRHAIASGSSVGDIDNGSVFTLSEKSDESDEFEVWVAEVSGSPTGDVLWMAYSGEEFMPSLQPSLSADDIHEFTNENGSVFPAYKPQLFDLITMNADALYDAFAEGDEYIIPVEDELKLGWTDTLPASGLAYKLIQTTYFSFGSTSLNGFGTDRETAYIFECVQV